MLRPSWKGQVPGRHRFDRSRQAPRPGFAASRRTQRLAGSLSQLKRGAGRQVTLRHGAPLESGPRVGGRDGGLRLEQGLELLRPPHVLPALHGEPAAHGRCLGTLPVLRALAGPPADEGPEALRAEDRHAGVQRGASAVLRLHLQGEHPAGLVGALQLYLRAAQHGDGTIRLSGGLDRLALFHAQTRRSFGHGIHGSTEKLPPNNLPPRVPPCGNGVLHMVRRKSVSGGAPHFRGIHQLLRALSPLRLLLPQSVQPRIEGCLVEEVHHPAADCSVRHEHDPRGDPALHAQLQRREVHLRRTSHPELLHVRALRRLLPQKLLQQGSRQASRQTEFVNGPPLRSHTRFDLPETLGPASLWR